MLSVVALAALFYHYFEFRGVAGGRPWEEVATMLPTTHSWLFTSGHIIEFFNDAGSQLQAKHEHFMFVGITPIVMLFIAVFVVIKEKNTDS